MKWMQWFKWLAGAALIAAVPAVVGGAVAWGYGSAPLGSGLFRAAAGLAGFVLAGWVCSGALKIMDGPQRPWGKWVQAAVASALLLAALAGVVVMAVGGGALESAPLRAAVGVLAVGWAFAIALGLARLALGSGPGPIGVARTVLDEAIRMKVAVVFMALLLLVLPILPFVIGGENPLRYRVQSFLSWSLAATGVLLSLMTIFLACGTLSREIEQKQIFMLAVKPIGRTAFLLGKWLGIIVLDAVLLAVAGVAIYLFTVGYLANLPAQSAEDAAALREEVLTARVSTKPIAPEGIMEGARQRFESLRREDPAMVERAGGERAAQEEVLRQAVAQWRSIGPRDSQRYIFTGLGPVRAEWERRRDAYRRRAEAARQRGEQPPAPNPLFVQLRYKIQASGAPVNSQIPMEFSFNQNRHRVLLVADNVQVIPIPAGYIGEDGRLNVTIANPPNNPTVSFGTEEGLQILYEAGGFGGNFLRGLLAIWIKLTFLAMLGLMAATFLGFPVACSLSLLVFLVAMASPFLLESVQTFAVQRPGQGRAPFVYLMIKWIGWALGTLLEQYGRFNPRSLVVDGRMFSWSRLAACLMWIGVAWTALTGVLAAIIFHRRELARVQV